MGIGELLLYVLLVVTFVAAIVRPWVGVLAGYLFAVLKPQAIWFWMFVDLRPFLVIAVGTMLGIVLGAMSGQIQLRS